MPNSLTGPNPMPKLPKAFDNPQAHEDLLSDWLDWRGHFPALAAKHGLTIDQLLDWHQSDEIQRRLKRLAEMAQSRAFYLAQLHRTDAITRLSEMINDTRAADPKDRIRAATQLLRLAKQADEHQSQGALSAPSAHSATSAFSSAHDPAIPSSRLKPTSRAVPRNKSHARPDALPRNPIATLHPPHLTGQALRHAG